VNRLNEAVYVIYWMMMTTPIMMSVLYLSVNYNCLLRVNGWFFG